MAGGSGGRRDGIGHQLIDEGGADGVVVLQGDDAGHPPVAGALEGEGVGVVDDAVDHLDGDGLVTRTLLDALDETWERGWQPADVAHVARRKATAGSVPLTTALIAEHARRTSAVERAPDTWVDQLRELGALDGAPSGGGTVVVVTDAEVEGAVLDRELLVTETQRANAAEMAALAR